MTENGFPGFEAGARFGAGAGAMDVQASDETDPMSELVPTAQFEQLAWPTCVWYVPAAQLIQLIEPTKDENVPGAQLMQLVPVTDENMPAAQGTQPE